MSGSEDGQLHSGDEYQNSSGNEQNEDYELHDDDDDALHIKPPQARRDETRSISRRKTKKHSKVRKRKEHRTSGGGERRERETTTTYEQHRSHHRDFIEALPKQHNAERLEQHRRSEGDRYDYQRYERNHYERRYQSNQTKHIYHYQQQQQQQQQQHHQSLPVLPLPPAHFARQQHQHHHLSEGRSIRHEQMYALTYQQSGSGRHHAEQYASNLEYVSESKRRNNYEQQQRERGDAESLEQDLRDRLLSKRHKYVNEYDVGNEHAVARRHSKKHNRDIEEPAQKVRHHKSSTHHHHIDKDVIELIDDSPRREHVHKHKRKRSHVHKEKRSVDRERIPLESIETVDLDAISNEREKHERHRKEEAEARCLAKQRISALSPSAVAASVTASLHAIKRKTANDELRTNRKKSRTDYENNVEASANDDDADDDDEDDESDGSVSEGEADETAHSSSESGSNSSSSSSDSPNKVINTESKIKCNSVEKSLPLAKSPRSIGDLQKSTKESKKPNEVAATTAAVSLSSLEESKQQVYHRSRFDSSSSESTSSSRTGSRSHSRSHSRSRTHTRSRSRSRSRSEARSASSGMSDQSDFSGERAKRGGSSSDSSTRSEERDMEMHKNKEKSDSLKRASTINAEQPVVDKKPPCDENGVPLPDYYPGVQGCRSVEEFQCLNRIEEGTYGVVYRAKDKRTNEIVALKRLKMEKEKEGFPITSLREINTLLKGQHPNIVTVREIVVGSNMDKIFIVMDYVEHDLKSLMETMKHRKQSFRPEEVKCLIKQLMCAVAHLHDNWILHRDLKTSNLLLSHKGVLKVGDFGLAREYGSPLKNYTSLVVTLWYRAPELLLCTTQYSTPIDMWSVGCIFAEFLQMAPLFPGKSETDEINRIFKLLGTPSEKIWPGYNELPMVKNMISQNPQFAEFPISQLRKQFINKTTEMGIDLLQGMLTFDPKQRLTAEAALSHTYFDELPPPIDPKMFPTWPAKSELGARKALASSPKPPSGGSEFKQLGRDEQQIAAATANAVAAAASKKISGIITGNKRLTGASGANNSTGFVLNAGVTQQQLAMSSGFSLKF